MSGPRRNAIRTRLDTIRTQPLGLAGFTVVAAVAIAVLAAPLIAPCNPDATNYGALLQPPGSQHWFGTDNLGRDIFSRVLYGGRATLGVAALGVLVAAAGGTLIGVVAGYYGRLADAALMRLVDVWLSFPVILLVLSIIVVLGPGLAAVTVALGFGAMPTYARVVRGSVLAVRHRDYVRAAKVSGARDPAIMAGHVLPNVAGPLIVYTMLGLGGFIIGVSGLDFLGLGAQPPAQEWGALLAAGDEYLTTAWWMSVFPGAAIFLTVLGINLAGSGLRDLLDPQTSLGGAP